MTTTNPKRERPQDIERDIEARREELATTLETLQERASPKVLAEGLGYALRDESGDLLAAASRVARRNPVAVALIAAGAAWLAFGPDLSGADGQGQKRRRVARAAGQSRRSPAPSARRPAPATARPTPSPAPRSFDRSRVEARPAPPSGLGGR